MWDLSSSNRDWTCTSCIPAQEAQSLDHWTASEIPILIFYMRLVRKHFPFCWWLLLFCFILSGCRCFLNDKHPNVVLLYRVHTGLWWVPTKLPNHSISWWGRLGVGPTSPSPSLQLQLPPSWVLRFSFLASFSLQTLACWEDPLLGYYNMTQLYLLSTMSTLSIRKSCTLPQCIIEWWQLLGQPQFLIFSLSEVSFTCSKINKSRF